MVIDTPAQPVMIEVKQKEAPARLSGLSFRIAILLYSENMRGSAALGERPPRSGGASGGLAALPAVPTPTSGRRWMRRRNAAWEKAPDPKAGEVKQGG